jgi:hypothetical protein
MLRGFVARFACMCAATDFIFQNPGRLRCSRLTRLRTSRRRSSTNGCRSCKGPRAISCRSRHRGATACGGATASSSSLTRTSSRAPRSWPARWLPRRKNATFPGRPKKKQRKPVPPSFRCPSIVLVLVMAARLAVWFRRLARLLTTISSDGISGCRLVHRRMEIS